MKEKYPNEIGIFMMASGLNYEAISDEEKDEKREKLQAASGYGIIKFDDEKFYRVGWLEAMDLVRARRVLVEAGLAYIPSSEVLSLVMGVFRARLSHNLVLTCRALPVLEDDARLVSMVQNLDKVEPSLGTILVTLHLTFAAVHGRGLLQHQDCWPRAAQRGGRAQQEELPPVHVLHPGRPGHDVEVIFTLCLQHVLTTTHHVKYKARLQYGLFLKGIGMTLEDAMKFFRGEFTKRHDVDVDKFEKEYAYGIR